MFRLKKANHCPSFSGHTDIGLFNVEVPENCLDIRMRVNAFMF